MDQELFMFPENLILNQCCYCLHSDQKGHCSDGIPQEIQMNWHDHRTPHPDDHGIQFEPRPELRPEEIKIVPSRPGRGKN